MLQYTHAQCIQHCAILDMVINLTKVLNKSRSFSDMSFYMYIYFKVNTSGVQGCWPQHIYLVWIFPISPCEGDHYDASAQCYKAVRQGHHI
jgi:hypothetical protein